MRVINFSDARNQFKQVIDQVVADCDVAVISRRDAEDAVVMSLNTYNSMMETFHLLKSPANVKHLEKSLAQYRKGKLKQRLWWMLSKLAWTNAAWGDYIYWQGQDKKTLRRINSLIKDALRNPKEGIGKPEELRESLSGFWSRRIDDVNRLVYAIEKDQLVIIACRYHYD